MNSKQDRLGAIRAAARGETVLSPTVATRLLIRMRHAKVKTQLLRAFAKLGVSDRTAAVVKAMSLELIPPDAGTWLCWSAQLPSR